MTASPPLSPPPPAESRRTSGLAIASLVLGLGFCLGALTGIPAVVCGHVALGKIKRSGGTVGGRGLAIGGLVLGYLGIFLMLVAIILAAFGALMSGMEMARGEAEKAACSNNLHQIGIAFHMYAAEHGDRLPEKLSDLYAADTAPLEVFACPASDTTLLSGSEIDAKSDYVYLGAGVNMNGVPSPATFALVREKPGHHDDGAVGVLYLDGHVERIPAGQAPLSE